MDKICTNCKHFAPLMQKCYNKDSHMNNIVVKNDSTCDKFQPYEYLFDEPPDDSYAPIPDKHDDGKLPFHLIPPEALEAMAETLQYGLSKYEPRNWEPGMDHSKVFAAAQRHLWAYWKGEDKDPESGVHHLFHAISCVAFLCTYIKKGLGKDDRP